jgi:formate dehydrogenase major subunit
MSRWLPYLSELQPEFFCEVSPELAREKGLRNGGWATILTARAAIETRVLVTERLQPVRLKGRVFHQIGLPYHWGSSGRSRGDSANELSNFAADPNVSIMNSKAHTANIEPGRQARSLRPNGQLAGGVLLPGDELRDLPVARHRVLGKHLVRSSKDKQGDQT